MSPPYRDFETQTWKKVVDADVVEVRQHQYFQVCTCLVGCIDFDLALFSGPQETLPMQSDSFDVPFKAVVKFWPHRIHSFWP